MPNTRVVVALHSLFFDGTMFDDLRAGLPGFEVHSPDHRGQGTRAGEQGRPTLTRLAADTVDYVRGLNRPPVHLVGSSMGAYVAILAAAQAPELFRTCVLSGATGDAEERPEHFRQLVVALRAGPVDIVDNLAHTMFGDSFLSENSPVLRHWKGHFGRLAPSIADAAEEVFAREALWPLLDTITMPLLLIGGAEDHAKPAENMARIALRKPGSILTVVPRAGHTPFVERPEYLSSLVRRWCAAPTREQGETHDHQS